MGSRNEHREKFKDRRREDRRRISRNSSTVIGTRSWAGSAPHRGSWRSDVRHVRLPPRNAIERRRRKCRVVQFRRYDLYAGTAADLYAYSYGLEGKSLWVSDVGA